MMATRSPDPPAPHRRLTGSRAAAALGLAALVVALSASAALHESLMGVFDAARGLLEAHPVAGPAVFVALAAASAMLAFFSSAALVPAGVVTWGAGPTVALLALGWLLGGLFAYGLARGFGRALLTHLTSVEALAPYERRIGRDTPFGVVLLFQLALPSEVPGYVLGLARYPVLKYLAALACVEVPYAIATVWLGQEFVAREVLPFVAVVALGAGVAALAVQRVRRHLTEPDAAPAGQVARPGGTRPAHGRSASS